MPWLEDLKFPRGYQMGTHILIWICNRMAYYYLSGNTSLIVSGIILIIGCLIMWGFNHEYR